LKVKDIEDKRNVSITQLNDALKSCVDVFDARVQTSLQEIDNKTQKGRQILETVANEGVKKVIKEAENVIKEVQKAVVQTRKTRLELFLIQNWFYSLTSRSSFQTQFTFCDFCFTYLLISFHFFTFLN
jgi:hypothetical protein